MTKRNIPDSYYAVFIDYGRKGLEAIVDPEMTRRDVVARIKSGEFANIAFIHHVCEGLADDVTDDLLNAAEAELKAEANAGDGWVGTVHWRNREANELVAALEAILLHHGGLRISGASQLAEAALAKVKP